MSSPLDFLFPVPSRPLTGLSPAHWPGVSPTSTEVLLQVLKHNHEHWHTFFNAEGFHNHAPHRSLALWAMGADGDVIRAGYEKDCGYEKPAIIPPGEITKENFIKHLGDERFYRAYLDFFAKSLSEHGTSHTLEEYVFSSSANVGIREGLFEEGQMPLMLARFFSGLVHPLIHTGYGVEFGLPGLTAEGLAQTAVTKASIAPLIPPSLFDSAAYSALSGVAESAGKALHDAFGKTVQSLDAAFESVLLKPSFADEFKNKNKNSEEPKTEHPSNIASLQEKYKTKDIHALDILGWVAKDMRHGGPPKSRELADESIAADSETLLKFARLWKLDVSKLGTDKRYLEGKIEELAFFVTVMYGIGGWTERGDAVLNADFVLMHLVTSSVFLPSICASISPESQARLLHTYLVYALGAYVARGCPKLDIAGFHNAKEPQPSGPQPTPSEGTLPSPQSPKAVNPDPWLPIIQTSVVHPDEHVPKTQRALSNWASAFGLRRFSSGLARPLGAAEASEAAGLGMGWGGLTSKGVGEPVKLELEGAEYLDGTVFLKTAELTAKRMGRVREGEKEGEFWNFSGFFTGEGEDSSGSTKARL